EVLTGFQTVPLVPVTGKTLAVFEDGSNAIVEASYNKGKIFSYGFWPGITYHLSPDRSDYKKLPQGWSEEARKMVTMPAKFANAQKLVEINQPLVEGCYLFSEKGIAVILLNWSGKPISELELVIDGAENATKVESIEHKSVRWEKIANKVKAKLPLKTVDVLMLYF
ncbi:MAG: hypothetical protein NC902_06090, partial [Candidatus Omnitrophica bacterium]|nr:hypothetical protein [Candidatus Omnitrophota bacterium]